jgi:hypothetical protein
MLDLAVSDFHLFWALNQHLGSHRLKTDVIKTAVKLWLK